MTVTCRTAGCENAGIAIEIADTWTDIDGSTRPVEVVQCGVCLEWIIAPIEPPEQEDTMQEPDSSESVTEPA